MRCLLLGLVPALPIGLVLASCQRPAVNIGLVLRAPEGLLDTASGVRLNVFDASLAACNVATGHVKGVPQGGDTQTFDLTKGGCAAGATWCKQIDLDRDGSDKMFAVAVREGTATTAEGCTTAVIDQDPLEVDIKVHRVLPPACCGDGYIQPGEQCDSGVASPTDCFGGAAGKCSAIVGDEVCACDCKAQEIPLDRAATDAPPPVGVKAELALTFAAGDTFLDGALRAAFTDTAAGANGGADVELRYLDRDLYAYSSSPQPALTEPLRIPLKCTQISGAGSIRQQHQPSIASIAADAVAVAYASDERLAGMFDVMVSAQNQFGCASADPQAVNTTSGIDRPDVAGGPTDEALVVWTQGNQVIGRRLQVMRDAQGGVTFATVGNESVIAANGSAGRVAGYSGGWLIVYQGSGPGDGDGIYRRTMDSMGTLSGETLVNLVTDELQDQPDVAMLDDGTAIVVWRSSRSGDTDIFFQRYDATGGPVAGDQNGPLNTKTAGQQASPVAAGRSGVFAVAWEDAPNADESTIYARFVGGIGGFAYNSVTGQNDAFLAAHPAVPFDPATQMVAPSLRRAPAITMGGSKDYVVIGWQDESPLHPGVYVRRFPSPELK